MTDPKEDRIESLREIWLTETDLDFLLALELEELDKLLVEVEGHHERNRAAEAHMHKVLAKTTKFLPNAIVGKLGNMLSPQVIAGITEHLDAKNAASLAKRFEPSMLGEITLHLPIAKTAEVARLTDLSHLLEVVRHMADKHLHHRLGELSDALDAGVLEKLVKKLDRAEHLAAIAGHMQDRQKLARVGRAMKSSRRAEVVRILRAEGHDEAATALG